jgi:hypothetical protein
VIPASTNSGDHWGRRRFLRPPGVIRIRVLPPLPARLQKEALMSRLEAALAEAMPRGAWPSSRDAMTRPAAAGAIWGAGRGLTGAKCGRAGFAATARRPGLPRGGPASRGSSRMAHDLFSPLRLGALDLSNGW